jgi:hypothetical protein
MPNEYVKFIRSVFTEYHITHNGMLLFKEPNVKAMRLLNVKYIITNKLLDHEELVKVFADDEQSIYQLKNWLPRAYCASDIILRDNSKTLDLRAIINKHDRPAVLSEQADMDGSSCRVRDLNVYTNNLDFRIETSAKGLVILPYGFNANWQATINDGPAKILRVNESFIGFVVPPGESRVHVYYQNNLETVSAVVLILGSVIVLALAIGSRGYVIRPVLIVVSFLVFGKSALSLPVLRNDSIPERSIPKESLLVEEAGRVCVEKTSVSPRIGKHRPWTVPLNVPTKDLVRLQLVSATYLQPALTYDVTVTLRDAKGEVLRQHTIPGDKLRDNRWFQMRFAPITEERELLLEVSSDNGDSSRDFSIWLDAQGAPCMKTYYRSPRALGPDDGGQTKRLLIQ